MPATLWTERQSTWRGLLKSGSDQAGIQFIMKKISIYKLHDLILFDQKLTHFDARLLLVLLWHRNRNNCACFPLQTTLAEKLEVTFEYVSKRLHVCRDHGYVNWKRSNQGLDY